MEGALDRWGEASNKAPFAQGHRKGHSKTGINKAKGMGTEENDVKIGSDQPCGLAGEHGQGYESRRREYWAGLAVLNAKLKDSDLAP